MSNLRPTKRSPSNGPDQRRGSTGVSNEQHHHSRMRESMSDLHLNGHGSPKSSGHHSPGNTIHEDDESFRPAQAKNGVRSSSDMMAPPSYGDQYYENKTEYRPVDLSSKSNINTAIIPVTFTGTPRSFRSKEEWVFHLEKFVPSLIPNNIVHFDARSKKETTALDRIVITKLKVVAAFNQLESEIDIVMQGGGVTGNVASYDADEKSIVRLMPKEEPSRFTRQVYKVDPSIFSGGSLSQWADVKPDTLWEGVITIPDEPGMSLVPRDHRIIPLFQNSPDTIDLMRTIQISGFYKLSTASIEEAIDFLKEYHQSIPFGSLSKIAFVARNANGTAIGSYKGTRYENSDAHTLSLMDDKVVSFGAQIEISYAFPRVDKVKP